MLSIRRATTNQHLVVVPLLTRTIIIDMQMKLDIARDQIGGENVTGGIERTNTNGIQISEPALPILVVEERLLNLFTLQS